MERSRSNCMTRFFPRLPQRHFQYIALTIRMAARLQPAIELAVACQQDMGAPFVYYPRRTGDVSRREVAFNAGIPNLDDTW